MKNLILLIFGFLIISNLYSQKQSFTINDVLHLEQFGASGFKKLPNGNEVTFEIQRPRETAKNFNEPFLVGEAQSDIYSLNIETRALKNITGSGNNEGYWDPKWSPDSKHIAMYSTAESDNFSLWVYNLNTKQKIKLHDNISSIVEWLSEDELLYNTLPEDQENYIRNILKLRPQKASAEWQKASTGAQVASSVLESRLPYKDTIEHRSKLIKYNIKTNESTVVSQNQFSGFSMSEDKKTIAAYVIKERLALPKNKVIPNFSFPMVYRLELLDMEGNKLTNKFSGIYSVLVGSASWSSNSQKLAFQGAQSIDDLEESTHPTAMTTLYGIPLDLFIYDIIADSIQKLQLPKGLKPVQNKNDWQIKLQYRWINNSLAILAESTNPNETRKDWWLYAEGTWSNLTSAFKNPSIAFSDMEESGSILGIVDGNIWKFGGDKPVNLTSELKKEFLSISFAESSLLITTAKGDKEGLQELGYYNINTKEYKKISKPHEKADLVAFSEPTKSLVFKLEDNTGSYLWLEELNKKPLQKPILEFNTFLRDIMESKAQKIEYTSLNGEPLVGHVYLPDNYMEGKKYPLITYVYKSSVRYGEPKVNYNDNSVFNRHILTGQGYVVLVPSMPGSTADYLGMQNGVMPAVDKVVDLGIADQKKLVVMGQSAGGYTTQCLITQTNRFKAAVSMAGYSNLTSMYGQLAPRTMYESNAEEDLFQMFYFEIGGANLGTTPWKSPFKYVQNSPLFFADRINTPLLIIQGDLDYVPIAQGEEMFHALYRQGKRARFLRYWGEGHVFSSPANIRDMYNKIFKWLEENNCAPSG